MAVIRLILVVLLRESVAMLPTCLLLVPAAVVVVLFEPTPAKDHFDRSYLSLVISESLLLLAAFPECSEVTLTLMHLIVL